MASPNTTYATLVADIKAYMSRGQATDTTFVNQIPRIITKMEFKLARENKSLLTQPPVQGTLTAGNPVLVKPARWRDTVDFIIATGVGFTTRKVLYKRAYQTASAYWPNTATTGEPKFYADMDINNWFIVPTPDQAYPCQFIMDERVAPLSDTNQTNVFTEMVPDMLLDACLAEADVFLKNWEAHEQRAAIYDRSLGTVQAEDKDRVPDKTQNVSNP